MLMFLNLVLVNLICSNKHTLLLGHYVGTCYRKHKISHEKTLNGLISECDILWLRHFFGRTPIPFGLNFTQIIRLYRLCDLAANYF